MQIIPSFGLAGIILMIGFLANYMFRKVGIPDILILIVLGILIGPVFGWIDPSLFSGLSEVFVTLALMLIMFEGGMKLNIYKVIQESPRAFLLAIVGIFATVAVASFFLMNFLGWSLLNSILFGTIIGGSSSAIVIPLMERINVSDKVKTLVSLESVFTDAICIIVAMALIQLVTAGVTQQQIHSVAQSIASAFSIGAVLGTIVGMFWLRTLKQIREESYGDIVTLSIVLLLYMFVEGLGGNGAIAVLVFGLVLGNSIQFSQIFRLRKPIVTGKLMERFFSEISFLIRTFFFVYLGLIVSISDIGILIFGIGLSIALLLGRFLAGFLTSYDNKILGENRGLVAVMLPRGLVSVVLAQLVTNYNIANVGLYSDIVFAVVMSTVLICAIGILYHSRKNPPRERKK